MPAGSRKLICPGETKKSGAKRSVPALSRTLTVAPARVVGNNALTVLFADNVAAVFRFRNEFGALLRRRVRRQQEHA
jgi:hypothetical protein